MFSPGVWWSGLRLNLCGSFVQSLQMNSYGVGVLRRLQCVFEKFAVRFEKFTDTKLELN